MAGTPNLVRQDSSVARNSRRYFCCAFSPFGVRRITLPRRAVASGAATAQPWRSSHPAHMALPSGDTPVSRGKSPGRVPETSRTRRVLALMGSEFGASASKSTVKANRTELRSGERDPLAGSEACAPAVTSRGRGSSTLPPCVGWITGR
jgi:hypothetical protein